MPHITTCTRCGIAYEDVSEEAANAPTRLCQPCHRAATRVPLIAPPESRVYDIAQTAAARGCRLVHDGRRVYVTPRPMPGEFEVAA